jgi:hypothetical protein
MRFYCRHMRGSQLRPSSHSFKQDPKELLYDPKFAPALCRTALRLPRLPASLFSLPSSRPINLASTRVAALLLCALPPSFLATLDTFA